MQVDAFLTKMVEADASDVHFKVGCPPGFRISGKIAPQGNIPLKPEHTEQIARAVLNEEQWRTFLETNDFDLSYSIPGVSRFRVNVMRQRGSISLVLRQIPTRIPTFEELGLPEICRTLSLKPRGLVLVTGPTGSGKSTTLAAMVDLVNSTEQGHILTMEDPIEFIHKDKMCYVNQREIGADTPNFNQALKRAMRQDPDVILIGELRDLETISLAVTAAETGHLVFGTLHTSSATKTVDRIVNVFPPEGQAQIRMQLSGAIQGVISQTLLPKIGGGRIAALEVLVATDAVRAIVREAKTSQMITAMQTGQKYGMQLLEEHLNELVASKKVTYEDALAKANAPQLIKRPGGGGSGFEG